MKQLCKRALALVLSIMMVLTMFAGAIAEGTAVDVQFRAMDATNDLAATNLSNQLTTNCVEGTGAMEYITTADNGDLMLFIYRNGQASNPANIAGAEYLVFDLWVEEDNMFNNIASDAGVNVDTAANLNAWGSSGGKANAAQVKAALKDLKAGWNKVIIQLNAASTATDAADMRLYMIASGVAANKKFIIDDVRFMNQVAVDGLFAEDEPKASNVQFRSCDQLGWQNTPRGEFYITSNTYTEGGGSIIADLDYRGDSKLHWAWLGSVDNRTSDYDTVDISNTIDENGDFYVTFDFWAEPEFVDSAMNHDKYTGEETGIFEGGLNMARFVLGVVTYGEGQASSMDSAKESIQIDKPANGDWSIYGLENGLQAGWNHMALKLNANNLIAGNEQYWDPTKLWGVKFHLANLWYDEKEAHGTAHVGFDDIRFMSVEQYEATFASTNAVKDVISKIAGALASEKVADINAAKAAYDALTDAQKAQVTNYEILWELTDGMPTIVNNIISSLPTPTDVTLEDEEAINEAVTGFNKLSEDQKAEITPENLEKLAAVKDALEVQKADKAAADAVSEQIAALNVQSLDDKAAVEATVAAYEALNDSAKKYVANKDALDAAVAAIAKIEKDAADANAFAELVNALPQTITLADKEALEAVKAVYEGMSAEAKSMVDEETITKYTNAKNVLASLQPYDITFRNFNVNWNTDSNIEDKYSGVWDFEHKLDNPSEGTQYVWAKSLKETDRLLLYIYAYNQNRQMDAEGNNPDGCSKIYVPEILDMYITFDFYVSDASLFVSATDVGLGIDTKEGGGSNCWGNTFKVKYSVVKDMVKGLKDGWNHVVLPLSWDSNSMGEKLKGSVLTVEDFRFYINNVNLPVDFVAGMDDVHFVNGLGLEAIDAKRAAAKEVTYAIRAFDGSYESFFDAYLAYQSVEEEYKDVILGWDAFISANAQYIAQAEEDFESYSQEAAVVDNAIAALPAPSALTLANKSAVEEARAMYENLSAEHKGLIRNLTDLVIAEQTIEGLEVAEQILALPATITLDDKSQVEAVQSAYLGLSTYGRNAVSQSTLNILNNALATIEQLEADQAAVEKVEALINALPSTITLVNQEQVAAADEAYNALGEALQLQVSNKCVVKLNSAKAEIARHLEDKKSGDALDVLIAQLPASDKLTVANKTQVDSLYNLYLGLNDNAKTYVTLYSRLKTAVDKIEELSRPVYTPEGPAFVVEGVTSQPGNEFTVAIKVQNNPGIVSAKLQLAFDSNLLEVVSLKAGDFAGVAFSPVTNNPLVINWVDSLNGNNTTDGVLAYVTFRVNPDVIAADSSLTLSYDEDDVFDTNLDNVAFAVQNGTVKVVDYISGDVNQDGEIDNKDLSELMRYLNNWNNVINLSAADVNCDGLVNNKDFSILQRYLNGWDVELKY